VNFASLHVTQRALLVSYGFDESFVRKLCETAGATFTTVNWSALAIAVAQLVVDIRTNPANVAADWLAIIAALKGG
jgi:hypothetical protein